MGPIFSSQQIEEEREIWLSSEPPPPHKLNVNTFITLDVLFGNQDQPWLVAMLVHEHPGLAVGIPPRVVDQSAKATRVHRCVYAPPLPPSAEVVDITSERAWVGIVVSVS